MPKKRKLQSPNAPRLNPEHRILSRFYEPLVLLCTLGRTRGEHQAAGFPRSTDVAGWPLKYARRLFLNELAFLCDYDTGGDSVTAISIQHTPQRRIFWVAANICPSKKIAPFVQNRLTNLKYVAESRVSVNEAMDQFLMVCTKHAKPRIKAYFQFLTKLINACRTGLEIKASEDESCKIMLAWLKAFQSRGAQFEELCKFAYESRGCEEMHTLKALCGEVHSRVQRTSLQARCTLIRHYIGRLGQYVKTVSTLLRIAPRLLDLLEFTVCTISPPARGSPPPVDGKTNLDSIVKRMLPAQSPDLARYQSDLSEMDMRFQIYARFMELYCDDNFKPRIHAEVQVLDFFHKENMKFEESDIFVACSKPACYCCALYFHHHPLRPVTPATHQTIHKNWRPPDFMSSNNTQKDILNKMIKDLRTEALRQIDQRRPNAQWHPDSTTGITESTLHLVDLESSGNLSEISEISDDFGDTRSETYSLPSDEEHKDQEYNPHHQHDGSRTICIEPSLSSDLEEEDSSEDGGVLLQPSASGTENVDDAAF